MNNLKKYKKEELEKLIFEDKISYKEIGRRYGVSDTNIKKVSKLLGIVLPVRAKFSEDFKPHNFGSAKKINCNYCNKEIIMEYSNQKYCSKECSFKGKTLKTYNNYISNQDKYCDVNKDIKFLKPFILKDQNRRCIICDNIDVWNDKKIIFVLDHIDGNASNNLRENLRLVCPNCDSQLDTYKSKNKNSARKERYLKNYKN